MTAVFLLVVHRRCGYVATTQYPKTIAMGSSAVVAAENGVLAVRAILGNENAPPTLIIRVERPGRSTIVMQPIDKPICLDSARVGPLA